jgi:hypothetical protein
MNYFKVVGLFLATTAIFAAGLIGLGACAGNAEITPIAPKFKVLWPPPIEVTIEQLYQEYITDEAAANAKYEGQRLLFTNVVVEEINSLRADNGNDPGVYLVNASVEFRPRYWIDVALITDGFVVDIVGTPKGIFGIDQKYLVVDDASVFIIEGDVGADYEEPGTGY